MVPGCPCVRSVSNSSAMRRSSRVVILRLPGSEPTIRTIPPARSTSQASSVASASSSSDADRARSSAARRNTCGVCTAHSRDRDSVRCTVRPSSPTSLIVSVTGVAAITASTSGARSSSRSACSNSCGVASGRAASWTITGSPDAQAASAARTECERCSPPATAIVPSGAASSSSAGSAITTAVTAATARSAATLHSSMGRPQSGTSALGRPDPRRSPLPAATINATAIYLA